MALPASDYDTATLTNPDSSLTDFSLIVDLSRMSAAWWSAVDTSDGTKGRAAKDSGPTELACDWINFDDSAQTGLLRVKWSGTLSDTGTQILRIYPPQTANASVAANATYGSDNAYDANWIGYWPAHEAAGDLIDRTSNGLDAFANGTPTRGVTGQLGDAVSLDGSTTSFEVSSFPVTAEAFTMMAWAQGNTASDVLMVLGSTTANDAFSLYSSQSGGVKLAAGVSGTTGSLTGILPFSGWWHGAGVWSTTTSRTAYLDGVAGTTDTFDSSGLNVSSGTSLGLGCTPRFNGQEWNGPIQHWQFHDTARSADWIKYEYDQTNDQATFYGTWVYSGAAATTTTSSGAGTALPAIMHHRRMMGVS